VRLSAAPSVLVANDSNGPYAAAGAAALAEWESGGKLPGEAAEHIEVEAAAEPTTTLEEHRAGAVSQRQFDRALAAAACARRDADEPLEIQIELGGYPAYEPLWIAVDRATVESGSWTFRGTLQEASRSLQVWRAGLPLETSDYEVRAFRQADGVVTTRPR
jgi:hypothetical protein